MSEKTSSIITFEAWERLERLAKATNKALADSLIVNQEAKRLLRKIYNRANPSILEDDTQTRRDSDLLDEIEAFLEIRNEKEQTTD